MTGVRHPPRSHEDDAPAALPRLILQPTTSEESPIKVPAGEPTAHTDTGNDTTSVQPHHSDPQTAQPEAELEDRKTTSQQVTSDVAGPSHTQEPIQRPGIIKFLRYSLGGSLPARHSTWVLHDVTCRTWFLHHFARTLLVVVPLLVAYLSLMPASLGLRLLTGLTFSGAIFIFSLVNVGVDTDRRAVRAGYGFSLPANIRNKRSEDRQRLAVHLRRERIAERRERRMRRN